MAPPMQAAHKSALHVMVSGNCASVTMSAMANRPPDFRRRAASRNTDALSGARLMTPLLMTTSALASAHDVLSMEGGCRAQALGLVQLRIGHVDANHLPL